MKLRFDGGGSSSEAIGEYGINAAQYGDLQPRLQAARTALKQAWDDSVLGFFECPDTDPQPIMDWAAKIAPNFTDQIVIGIGGSSLGTRAVLESYAGELNGLRTHVTENVDPSTYLALLDSVDLSKTLFIVITKSGTTIETMAKFWIAYDRVLEELGEDAVATNFVGITDPKAGSLRPLSAELGFKTWSVPPNVGGRFSVLTPVGLVPLALAGYPIDELLNGAKACRDAVFATEPGQATLERCAADHYLLHQKGYAQTVMMPYADRLDALSEWFCQLWGESLGKAKNRAGEIVNVGLTPVRALGVIDQHSQVQLYAEGPRDKHVVFLQLEDFGTDVNVPGRSGFPGALSHIQNKSLSKILTAELDGTQAALTAAGRPTSRWVFSDGNPVEIGAFIFAWEYVTAVMGELFDINAFDQPGVEGGKLIAHGLLGKSGYEEHARVVEGANRNVMSIV